MTRLRTRWRTLRLKRRRHHGDATDHHVRDPFGTCLFCGGRPEDACPCALILRAGELAAASETAPADAAADEERPGDAQKQA